MLKNYLITAFRSLWRQKGHAAINVAGLSAGVACCLLIMLFVRDELSYDRFHENSDRIYRAWVLEDYGENEVFFNTVTPFPLGPALHEQLPEVETFSRVYPRGGTIFRVGDEVMVGTPYYVDEGFFDMFDFKAVAGSPGEVIRGRESVALTERIAERMFGRRDVVGEAVIANLDGEDRMFTVGAVLEDMPENSSIRPNIIFPFAIAEGLISEQALNSWFNVSGETYVLLRPDADQKVVEAKLPAVVRQVVGEMPDGATYTIGLQPITGIHLDTSFPAGLQPISDPVYSYILSAIAVFILLIACINFVTISVSRSAARAQEVGVRKAIGASQRQVMAQFWGEAVIVTAIALIFGALLAHVFLPTFNEFADRQLVLQYDLALFAFAASLLVIVGVVAGFYPAAVLSSFRPIDVLKGKLKISGDRSFVRRGLVVTQFALSIVLIVGTMVAARQMHYVQNVNLGYDRELVLVFPTDSGTTEGFRLGELFRNEIPAQAAVQSMTVSTFPMGAGWKEAGFTDHAGTYRRFKINYVDTEFLATYDIPLAGGRDFSRGITADESQSIIINEALARQYGWENPIGQQLPGNFEPHEIIGVVRDFHFESLHTPVQPLVLAPLGSTLPRGMENVMYQSSPRPDISVRISGENVRETIASLENTWNTVAPGLPFDYYFVDEAIDAQYRNEQRMGRMVTAGAGFAVFIACLGLFGLASLSAARRRKEIGLRKVLGASVPRIVALLSQEFSRLVIVAFVIAVPVAWWASQSWLGNFAYRIELSWWLFALAGAAALFVAVATVAAQALRAAYANPVDALRNE